MSMMLILRCVCVCVCVGGGGGGGGEGGEISGVCHTTQFQSDPMGRDGGGRR